ncbi:MAG: Gfo/Idh/MocA family oxidoreductase, partial [Erysipelotrichaceae bacterium]|nr:Gfo/Idh/MocA family oxidoreductase [Erysipelotrichaceae bacterium]
MKKINIGILGSGFIVPVFIEMSKLYRQYHLRAIWGRHEEKLLTFKEEFEYYTTDLEAFLSDEKIDVVYIALPNALHYEYALKALEHGKHVILEKPFTVHKKEAKKLIDLAKKKGL